MTELPYTVDNVEIIQQFIDETRARMSNGIEITFTNKANSELEDLLLEYDVNVNDVENAILNLSVRNYYRGIDPSTVSDFNVCAFKTTVGNDDIEIYIKYGLQVDGLQILMFSNHTPNYPMVSPFNN